MGRESVIEKLRKLLAKAADVSSQAEAELAADMASRLMEKYQVEYSEVALEEAEAQEVESFKDEDGDKRRKNNLNTLANSCAKLFDAAVYITTDVRTRRKHVMWVGYKSDVQSARILFEYLKESWESIHRIDRKAYLAACREECGKPIHATTYRNSHCWGFSIAIRKRVKEIVASRKSAVSATATGGALVLYKDQSLKDYLARLGLRTGRASINRGAGYGEGSQAGSNAVLGGRLQGGQLRLGG